LKEKWENPEKKNCNLCKKKKGFVFAYIIVLIIGVLLLLQILNREKDRV
jgi:competence protein ComGC